MPKSTKGHIKKGRCPKSEQKEHAKWGDKERAIFEKSISEHGKEYNKVVEALKADGIDKDYSAITSFSQKIICKYQKWI